MNTKADNEDLQNSDLAKRFTQMRLEEAGQLPALSNEASLAQRSPIIATPRAYRAMPSIAAAMAIVVIVGVLFIERTPEDPGRVYAEIMSASSMETDQLMAVSRTVLPELNSLPGIF